MQVRPYSPDRAEAWNALNRRARNGHFLFDRAFMDYHADRFIDASLIVGDGESVVAILPANRVADEVWSHQGLTFGGLISNDIGTRQTLEALDACAAHLAASGAKALVYKASPWIYARAPAQEDLYWLFRRHAVLARRDVSTAIDYRARGPVSSRRKRGARKAEGGGLRFLRSEDWAGFWVMLEAVLARRHASAPVHSLTEIRLLASRFPEEIALYTAEREGAALAGVVMFRSAQVAHAQYIAANDEGRDAGALDGLFDHLITAHEASHRCFDFGISNTDQGWVLNEGLIRQKEEFGASAVVHDVYRVTDLG